MLRQRPSTLTRSQTQPEELRMKERGGKHNRTMKAECENDLVIQEIQFERILMEPLNK